MDRCSTEIVGTVGRNLSTGPPTPESDRTASPQTRSRSNGSVVNENGRDNLSKGGGPVRLRGGEDGQQSAVAISQLTVPAGALPGSMPHFLYCKRHLVSDGAAKPMS